MAKSRRAQEQEKHARELMAEVDAFVVELDAAIGTEHGDGDE